MNAKEQIVYVDFSAVIYYDTKVKYKKNSYRLERIEYDETVENRKCDAAKPLHLRTDGRSDRSSIPSVVQRTGSRSSVYGDGQRKSDFI